MSIGGSTALTARPAEPRKNHGPVDPRLLRYARAARGYLVLTVALGLAGTALILAQACSPTPWPPPPAATSRPRWRAPS